jgi:hypothetical protein
MLPQVYTRSERPFGTTDWLTKYTYKYQKRECQDCGHVQTRKAAERDPVTGVLKATAGAGADAVIITASTSGNEVMPGGHVKGDRNV